MPLCQLLFDEERPQVRKLPRASNTQYHYLNESPSHNPGIRRLGLISELGLSLLYDRLAFSTQKIFPDRKSSTLHVHRRILGHYLKVGIY